MGILLNESFSTRSLIFCRCCNRRFSHFNRHLIAMFDKTSAAFLFTVLFSLRDRSFLRRQSLKNKSSLLYRLHWYHNESVLFQGSTYFLSPNSLPLNCSCAATIFSQHSLLSISALFLSIFSRGLRLEPLCLACFPRACHPLKGNSNAASEAAIETS